MMEVRNLTARTAKGQILLDHLTFTLRPGICVGLTGASGSGKTTLLKALLGVSDRNVTICDGQILLEGNDLFSKSEKERRELCGTTLGLIPQNPMTALNAHVPVGSQMTETFYRRLKLGKTDARDLSMEMLEKVHLGDTKRIYRAYPGQLSGGMLQRVTMAFLLGLSPPYIFADEPTSALDEGNKAYLLEELHRLKERAAILFVSHDDTAIRTLCEELFVLQSGTIVERGAAEQIFADPEQEWTREFAALSHVREGGGWTWEAYR